VTPNPDNDRAWVSAEYLLWWVKGGHLPPLVGSLPASQTGTNPLPPGSLTTLFGDDNFSFHEHSGGRFSAGFWLDHDHCYGIDGNGFFLSPKSRGYSAASPPGGDPIVGAIYTDTANGQTTIIFPVNPTQADETAQASLRERLWGAEANFRTRYVTFASSPIDLLAGFRYMDLAGDLDTLSTINFHGVGSRTFQDHFGTKNQFYGGQVGASLDMRDGPWSLLLLTKVALGGVRERLQIDGQTRENFFGGPTQTFPGGILAQPSNIGRFTSNRFAVLPEFTANLGFQIAPHVQAFFGYTFLYLSKVVRPGDAIDTVNSSFIRGLIVQNPVQTVRPLPTFNESSFWAQGLNFGVEVRY
jgi:hypothetical protein